MALNQRKYKMAAGAAIRQGHWETFRAKLADTQTLAAANALVLDGPEADSSGRSLYSNLRFFLQEFIVPSRATREEREGYVLLIKRLDAAGELKPGWGDAIIARLTVSLDSDR